MQTFLFFFFACFLLYNCLIFDILFGLPTCIFSVRVFPFTLPTVLFPILSLDCSRADPTVESGMESKGIILHSRAPFRRTVRVRRGRPSGGPRDRLFLGLIGNKSVFSGELFRRALQWKVFFALQPLRCDNNPDTRQMRFSAPSLLLVEWPSSSL